RTHAWSPAACAGSDPGLDRDRIAVGRRAICHTYPAMLEWTPRRSRDAGAPLGIRLRPFIFRSAAAPYVRLCLWKQGTRRWGSAARSQRTVRGWRNDVAAL